jgi:hypothetical protein
MSSTKLETHYNIGINADWEHQILAANKTT